MSIQILDIYASNKFDPEREKATGTDGVLIKGGQGQYPEYFARKCTFIEDCKRAGLPWGIYWQMDARYSPESHKAALKGAFPDKDFGPLELWLAVEMPFYPCPDALYKLYPYAWYKPIESVWRGMFAFTGKFPGIYTSADKWKTICGGMPISLQEEFASHSKLWVAQYKVKQPDKVGQWDKWTLWQYQAEPDYSVFNGSDDEFKKMFGLGDTTQVPDEAPAPQPPTATVTVKEYTLRLTISSSDPTAESKVELV